MQNSSRNEDACCCNANAVAKKESIRQLFPNHDPTIMRTKHRLHYSGIISNIYSLNVDRHPYQWGRNKNWKKIFFAEELGWKWNLLTSVQQLDNEMPKLPLAEVLPQITLGERKPIPHHAQQILSPTIRKASPPLTTIFAKIKSQQNVTNLPKYLSRSTN